MFQEINLITKRGILLKLARRKEIYLPLEIVAVEEQVKAGRGFDAMVTLGWRKCRVKFIAVMKARTAPKLISEGLKQLQSNIGKQNLLLIVPFLSKSIVEILEKEGLSGLDLSGNYLIQSSEMLAIRLDQENQYRESQPIKKIFSGNSALVGRLFLSTKKRFDSVNEVYSAIRELGGSLSLSTVSKVLKGLENELVIEKGRGGIAVIQPDKLLQRLKEDYRPPKIDAILQLKLPHNIIRNFGNLLLPSARWVLSGESSVERYAVTTPSEIVMIYTKEFNDLEKYEDERFYNVVLKKTFDSFPYFDVQERNRLRWASPIQCYLELSKLDKREQELAGKVRQAILEKLK